MPAAPPEGRKVKSRPVSAAEATDRHERAKDYLSPAEMARLLDAAKAGRPRRRPTFCVRVPQATASISSIQQGWQAMCWKYKISAGTGLTSEGGRGPSEHL